MNLNVKVEPILSDDSRWDSVKWSFVAILIVGIVVANIFLPVQTNALRLLWNLVASLIILSVASFTHQGKRAWNFAKEARIELRKVVWPTRQETIQSTGMIMIVVVITALFLWGVDSILLWAIGFVTGQRG